MWQEQNGLLKNTGSLGVSVMNWIGSHTQTEHKQTKPRKYTVKEVC